MGTHSNHQHKTTTTLRALLISILLVFGFGVVEAIAGWLSNSLALLGDAGHMASDAVALIIAAFAAWIAIKPPSKKHSYGFGRAEVVAAWISSLLLLAISIAVIVEAIARIHHHSKPINGLTVMLVAIIGIFINLLVAWVLSRGEKSLNTRAALLHVLSDLLASFAALISGAVIYFTGWLRIDPIISIAIGVVILISSIRILRESMIVLMEGVPRHINIEEVNNDMCRINGIESVHDLHIWTLSSGKVALSAHICIHDLSLWKTVLAELKEMFAEEYHIHHITLQPEPEIVDCQPCG